jgi:hypothetical protein
VREFAQSSLLAAGRDVNRNAIRAITSHYVSTCFLAHTRAGGPYALTPCMTVTCAIYSTVVAIYTIIIIGKQPFLSYGLP